MVWIRFSLLLVIPLIMAYVVDAFNVYSASALTGLIVLQYLSAAFLTLFTVRKVAQFGYGCGFTALGGLCLMISLTPILVLQYGV